MEQPSEQLKALHRALDALEASGIAYAVTGSWVVGAYGVLLNFGGRQAWALTAEDIILAKLQWIKISDSERQWRDVESVWALKKDELDLDYLKTRAARISVSGLLAKVIQ